MGERVEVTGGRGRSRGRVYLMTCTRIITVHTRVVTAATITEDAVITPYRPGHTSNSVELAYPLPFSTSPAAGEAEQSATARD